MRSRKLPPFDKYFLYHEAVQSPDTDVRFFRRVFRELKGRDPFILREDFCGTFQLCCEWVKLNPKNKAVGIDLDPEPLQYGREHHFKDLKPEQASRIALKLENVMATKLGAPKADITVALNFSYFLFRERALLLKYFTSARKALRPGSVFLIDCFGGALCQKPNEEKAQKKGFKYFWHQAAYNPITQFATFFIHFQRNGEEKRQRQFRYDWRMWSIPELRDILSDAGFKSTKVYWEGTSKNGQGNGVFRQSEKGDECQAFVAYIAAEN